MARSVNISSSAVPAFCLMCVLWVLAGVGGCSSAPQGDKSGKVIKIGLFTRGDDGFNDSGNIALVLLALREINQSGGLEINGEKYTFDLETAEFTDPRPEHAAALLDELVQRGVKAVLGPPWSSQILDSEGNEDGSWRRAREHEVVMISPSATHALISDLDDDDYVYRMMPPDSIQAGIAAQEAFSRGFRRISILRRDDAYASDLAARFVEEFLSLGGEIVAEQQYDISGEQIPDLKSYNFDSELDVTFGADPDLVYLLAFDEVARISQRIFERGDIERAATSGVQFLVSDALYDVGLLEGCAVVVLERLFGTTPGVDEASTNSVEFDEILAEGGLSSQWNASAQLYDSAYLVALAMQAADSIESVDFRKYLGPVSRADEGDVVVYLNDFGRARAALIEGEGVNYDGASGPIEIDEEGDPSAGTYLVWSVLVTDAEGVTLATEKSIPFGQ